MTSVRKRLDHVVDELNGMGTEPDEEASDNVIAELSVITAAYKESKSVPMCCFKYDVNSNVLCDVAGPLALEQFMEKCKQCQAQIKNVLVNLKTS